MLFSDDNICLSTDSYKLSHYNQYPYGTQSVYSHFMAREGSQYPYTLFNGLQPMLRRLAGVVVTEDDVMEARRFCEEHFGADIFNADMWLHIVHKHGGKLPVRIKAVREGSVVQTGNVLMTVENTDPLCWALTNHLETLLCHLWYPCNVATLSRMTKELMKDYLHRTSDREDEHLQFMLHDFGMRGVSSLESAKIGGAAHLINFLGTDTVAAIPYVMREYHTQEMPGFSVPATEHSVMTALGREGEFEQVQRLLHLYPTGILSVVSDSYDIYNACRVYGTRFKDQILKRDGKFVIRPDSGDPEQTVLRCLRILDQFFGSEENSKGYKCLPPQVGLIWGDGVDYDGINDILHSMMSNRWSADNIVFGMGGGLLQKHNRDTQRFAFKASAIQINGEWSDIYKDPRAGRKRSMRGRLALGKMGEQYYTGKEGEIDDDQLKVVFENGELTGRQTFESIRERAAL